MTGTATPRRLIPPGLFVVAGLFGWSGGAMSNPAVSVAPPFYRGRSPVCPILVFPGCVA